MKDRLRTLASAVLIVCAVVITGLNVRRELFSRGEGTGPRQGTLVEGWEALLPSSPPGPAAGAELIVFADYTCPYCRRLEGALDSLRAALGAEVRVRYFHFPLDPAGTGFAAAVASECAAGQHRGPAYHRLLYAHQDALGVLPWDSLAALAGVPDRSAFDACVREQRTADAVRRDRARGQALGVAATPTFLVNGRLYVGGATYAELLDHVRRSPRRGPS